ncbi:hypothetical protein LCGC14_0507340 [marine sediment metagenome]|uniref:HAMP domain-containing protein n=1 Tax=marine sediment metagenome TaxID=412755 RepID=A0A0F9UNV3_9ZZZZ
MPKSNEIMVKIKRTSARMIEANKGLRKAQLAYERISRLQYELPAELNELDWIRPIIDTAPYDALRGIVRALSNLDEQLNIHPATVYKVNEDDESRDAGLTANKWEKNLQWQMGGVAKRRKAFRSSIIKSAALYEEIVGQLIHLPTEFKARELSGSRERAALRFGDWAARMVDVKTVNVEYSDYMPERVLCAQIKTAQEVVDFHGDAARLVQVKINKDPDYAAVRLLELDYVDYENRAIWVIDEHDDVAKSRGIRLFGPEPWMTIAVGKDKGEPVPFLPWCAVAGGTDIDAAPEFQRQPVFFPVYQAEQWVNANIMGTLEMSRVTAEFAAPTHKITSPNPDDVEIEHGTAGGAIRLRPGELYEKVRKDGLDPGIMEFKDRLTNAMQRATVSDILVTGQPTVGAGPVSFAAYNLQVQVALAGIGNIIELGEGFYDQLYEKMLLISFYTGQDITGYGNVEKYTIDALNIDPSTIYLNTELKPDVPVDRVARVTAAVQMAQQLKYPAIKILEFLGENDPQGAMRLWEIEQMDNAFLQGLTTKLEAEGSGELAQLQQTVEQMSQMLEQQMQQAQQQPGQGTPENLAQGMPAVEGDIFNSATMTSPAQAGPSGNREAAGPEAAGLAEI